MELVRIVMTTAVALRNLRIYPRLKSWLAIYLTQSSKKGRSREVFDK